MDYDCIIIGSETAYSIECAHYFQMASMMIEGPEETAALRLANAQIDLYNLEPTSKGN